MVGLVMAKALMLLIFISVSRGGVAALLDDGDLASVNGPATAATATLGASPAQRGGAEQKRRQAATLPPRSIGWSIWPLARCGVLGSQKTATRLLIVCRR